MKSFNIFKGSNLFFTGITIYQVAHLFFWGLGNESLTFLIYLGPILLIIGLLINPSKNIPSPILGSYLLLLFAVIMMWLRFDPNGHNGGTIQDNTGSGAMLLFFLLLYPPHKFKINQIVYYSTITAASGVLFSFAFYNKLLATNAYQDMTYTSNEGAVTMAMSAIYNLLSPAILLLCYKNTNTKSKIIAISSVLLALLVAMVAGRRGFSLLAATFIIQYLILFLTLHKKINLTTKLVIIAALITLAYQYYKLEEIGQFQMFSSRIETDSRTSVFSNLIKDMNQDPLNWIIGKGVSGGYYDFDFGFIRPNIENGIANTLLKGGLLYLIPYVTLAINAIYLGLFKSNNTLMKGLSIYILTLLLFMFIWGTPSFSFLHMNMWIAYIWIFNKSLRKMDDEQLNIYLT